MKMINAGPVFRPCVTTDVELSDLVGELRWIEQDLKRRYKNLGYSERRLQSAERDHRVTQKWREVALESYALDMKLVSTGERLRRYLMMMLKERPEYAAAFHYTQ